MRTFIVTEAVHIKRVSNPAWYLNLKNIYACDNVREIPQRIKKELSHGIMRLQSNNKKNNVATEFTVQHA